MYKQELKLPKSARIFQRHAASAPPVGNFYYDVYHTLVVAPATSNTVAKCVYGISDNLATNVFAQAGKCRVPSIVFACDTAPELETEAPKGMVKVFPRRIDLENTERLKAFEANAGRRNVGRPGAALAQRKRDLAPMAERAHPFPDRPSRLPRLEQAAAAGSARRRSSWESRYRREGRGADDRGDHRAAGCRGRCTPTASSCPAAAAPTSTAWRAEFGVPFERGPDELNDLPALFRHAAAARRDLSRHDMRIFAEIVDASDAYGRRRSSRRAAAMRGGRRRRDRSRLPARHAVSRISRTRCAR